MTAREYKMPYGKYKGETLEEIYVTDIGYLEWMLESYQERSDTQFFTIQQKIQECFKEMRNVRFCE